MATYPLYAVTIATTLVSKLSAKTSTDFYTFISFSTAILSGISVEELDGDGLRVVVKQELQGVQFDVFPDSVSVLFLCSAGTTDATAFEVQVCVFLLRTLQTCANDSASLLGVQCQSSIGTDLLSQAEKFADDALAHIRSFALQCSDRRAICVRDIYLKLKKLGTTGSDTLALLETFCIYIETDFVTDAVFIEASKTLLDTQLSLEQLCRIDETLAGLI